MKDPTLLIIFALLLSSQNGFAGDGDANQLTDSQRQQLAIAVETLRQNGALTKDQNGATKIDEGIIKDLETHGLLKKDSSSEHTVCGGL